MHQMTDWSNSSQNLLTCTKSFLEGYVTDVWKFTTSKQHSCSTPLLELVVPILISTLSNPTKILWFRYPVWDKSPSKLQLLWETELRENNMNTESCKEENSTQKTFIGPLRKCPTCIDRRQNGKCHDNRMATLTAYLQFVIVRYEELDMLVLAVMLHRKAVRRGNGSFSQAQR